MRWSEEVAEQLARAFAAGAQLGPAQMRLVEKWQKLQDDRVEFDRQKWVRKLRGAPLGAGGASPGAGGAPPSAARPAPASGIAAGRGAPSFDARHVDDAAFRAHLAAKGLDVGVLGESRLQPPRPAKTSRERFAARAAQVRAERERKARETALAAERIDGRVAHPAAVALRLAQFGVRDAVLTDTFQPVPPPPPPPEKRTDPRVAARAAEVDAERWARGVVARGEAVNAKELSEVAYAALLRARGLRVDGSGPGFNAPLPRR
jgi:hypothetical protein